MSKKDLRYYELVKNIFHKYLDVTEEEHRELRRLQEELGIVECKECGGVGLSEVASIAGGTEERKCEVCEGLGEVGHGVGLKEKLVRILVE